MKLIPRILSIATGYQARGLNVQLSNYAKKLDENGFDFT